MMLHQHHHIPVSATYPLYPRSNKKSTRLNITTVFYARPIGRFKKRKYNYNEEIS